MFDSAKLMYATGGGAGFYDTEISQSLRFNDDDNAYLSRTPASAGNRKTWTWSGWVKGVYPKNENSLFSVWESGTDNTSFSFGLISTGQFRVGIWTYFALISNAVFRDPSAWYHFVVTLDTTQASASNRLRVYVNGEEITSWSTDNRSSISQNQDMGVNLASQHLLAGSDYWQTSAYALDGYLAEVNFIDGTALDPTSFGEFKSGVWIPKAYSDSYGTNGFYLPLTSDANDDSGNGNNWTANNLASTDYVLDSPTNNFATLNPLVNYRGYTLSEGNTKLSYGATWGYIFSTMTVTDKSYWEYLFNGNYSIPAISNINTPPSAMTAGSTPEGSGYGIQYEPHTGSIYSNSTTLVSGLATCSAGDIIGFAVDSINNTLKVYRNNTLLTTYDYSSTALGGYNEVYPSFAVYNQSGVVNFGQDSSFAGNKTAQGNTDDNGYGDFYYAPPSGYLALCTANLPDPVASIDPAQDGSPQDHFNTVLYTGDGTDNRSITGYGFAPDWIWGKARSNANSHRIADKVRGATKILMSDDSGAEYTGNSVVSFDSDGYTTSRTSGNLNYNGWTYVAWGWKAGGSGVSNTDGSITSTVSANTDAGFSIVSYTGTGGVSTIGHGLNSAPEVFFVKNRSQASDWEVYSAALGNTSRLVLNSTSAAATGINGWNSTSPTATVFTINGGLAGNTNGNNHIAYCFHSVEGFSKAFSYTGNGNSDGPMIYCGFKPAWVLIKRSSGATSDWWILDATRDPDNIMGQTLYANLSNAESTYPQYLGMDFVSNGIKLRTNWAGYNSSGHEYIGLAFAESPFKYSTAR